MNPYNDSDWRKMIEEANQKIQRQKQIERAPVVSPTEIPLREQNSRIKIVPSVMPTVRPFVVHIREQSSLNDLLIPDCKCNNEKMNEIKPIILPET